MRLLIFPLYLTALVLKISAQEPTVGLTLVDGEVSEGYILFTPESNSDVYLIDQCGTVVNHWAFDDEPNRSCYLLENGDLLRVGKSALEKRDWDGSILWSYDVVQNDFGVHHDIEPLPNGNVLCIVYDYRSKSQMVSAGRDGLITDEEFRLDKIVELKPIGTSSAEIVWTWYLYDHVVQDFDETKDNYGVISEHPELIDINYDNGEQFNFSHMNGIDYNSELDQIIFSARNLNEIYIIDHSTTTEEAASHSGGNSGNGGDILWRWGNPQVYDQGTEEDRVLGGQHNPEWVKSGYLDEGAISVFNNNPPNTELFSAIEVIEPEIINDKYQIESGKFVYSTIWSWMGEAQGVNMFEGKKSGVQVTPNGNIVICEANKGRILEVERNGDVIWAYTNPSGSELAPQFQSAIDNSIFRAHWYPTSYPAFENRDLESQGPIENENELSQQCDEARILRVFEGHSVRIVNPVKNGRLKVLGDFGEFVEAELFSMNGKKRGDLDIDVNGEANISLEPGMYLLKITSRQANYFHKILVE